MPIYTPVEVELADGSKVFCRHKIDRLVLKFTSFKHDTDLYVMDFKGEHDIILGRDFSTLIHLPDV